MMIGSSKKLLMARAGISVGGIQYVGGKTAGNGGSTTSWTTDLTGLSGGLSSTPSSGDLVILSYSVASTGSVAVAVQNATGQSWNTVASLFANSSGKDTNLFVAYSILSAGFSSTVTLDSTGSTSNAAAVAIQVFRGAAAPVLPAQTNLLTTSVLADPPSITPSLAGSWVVAVGGGASTRISATYTSSDLSGFITLGLNSLNDAVVGSGYVASDQTFNPAQFGFTAADATTFSSAAVTVEIPKS